MNDEGLVFDRTHVAPALEIFRREGVDALFIPHVNFGTEDAIARLARDLGKPVLLWGPRDEAPFPDGSRTGDTQCGLFATSKILRRMGVPFSYIVNSRIEDRGLRARPAKLSRGGRGGQGVPRRPHRPSQHPARRLLDHDGQRRASCWSAGAWKWCRSL